MRVTVALQIHVTNGLLLTLSFYPPVHPKENGTICFRPEEPGGCSGECNKGQEGIGLHHWSAALAGCRRGEVKMELSARRAPIHTSTNPRWTPDDLLKAEPVVGGDKTGPEAVAFKLISCLP